MKKINNNKFRGNAVYSLNYKFDSVSPAGKCSGTALDLIKRYNELAKEAQNNGDYVGMEVFRQYAEHYRKIVTEINERKYQPRENQGANNAANGDSQSPESQAAENSETADASVENASSEEQNAAENSTAAANAEEKAPVKKTRRTRAFTVVDASKTAEKTDLVETEPAKPHRRMSGRRTVKTPEAENVAQ